MLLIRSFRVTSEVSTLSTDSSTPASSGACDCLGLVGRLGYVRVQTWCSDWVCIPVYMQQWVRRMRCSLYTPFLWVNINDERGLPEGAAAHRLPNFADGH